MANVVVTFAVTEGEGSITEATPRTDASGVATAGSWTLGTHTGVNRVRATLGSLPKITFTATAEAGPAETVAPQTDVTSTGLIGATVAPPPAVVVRDRYGNGVPDIAVEFAIVEGSGSMTGAQQMTNEQGIATVGSWTLGAAAGLNSLIATIVGLDAVTFSVTAEPFNLWIETVHLNQGSQTVGGAIGAVSGRAGLLRVVVRADKSNNFAPPVLVRLYGGATVIREAVLAAPQAGVPTEPNLSLMSDTWNMHLAPEDVVAGLSVEAIVDPNETIHVVDRADNRYPRAGAPAPLDAAPLAPLRIVFIPVYAAVQGVAGNVSAGNLGNFLNATQVWVPSAVILGSLRPTYTTGLDLSLGANWFELVHEIQAVRTAEGAVDEYYHGIVGQFAGMPWGGYAYIPFDPGSPFRSAITHDVLPGAALTLAHELGHNFGRRHAPCGNVLGPDPEFPHPGAGLGSAGYNIVTGQVLSAEGGRDYMSYCGPQWTSDYTYDRILQWRRADPLARWDGAGESTAAGRTEGLLVWGRIQSKGVTLNPAFSLTTRPVLPDRDGPNEVRAVAADGSVIFRLSFEGVPVAHSDDPNERHFAYFLPLRADEIERIDRIELSSPHGSAFQRSAVRAGVPAGQLRPRVRSDAVSGNRARIRWEASEHPMAMVLDPATGRVLSIARNGEGELIAARDVLGRLQVILSDGVRSRVATRREE